MSTSLAAVNPQVKVVNGQPMANSRDVARCFGKAHCHVMESVKYLEVPDAWRKSNFRLSFIEQKIPNGAVRKYSCYDMTRDGFTILAMGFTGRKAMGFKIAYIEAFNRMERELRAKAFERPRFTRLRFPLESLRWTAERESGAILVLPEKLRDSRGTPLARLIDEVEKEGAELPACRAQLAVATSVFRRVMDIALEGSRLDPSTPVRVVPV